MLVSTALYFGSDAICEAAPHKDDGDVSLPKEFSTHSVESSQADIQAESVLLLVPRDLGRWMLLIGKACSRMLKPAPFVVLGSEPSAWGCFLS